MFAFIKQISDINRQINGVTIYKSIVVNINNQDYWIQYYNLPRQDSVCYNLTGCVHGCAAVQVIKKDNDNSYSVYKYNGIITIDRTLINNIIINDTIVNFKRFETEIMNFFT